MIKTKIVRKGLINKIPFKQKKIINKIEKILISEKGFVFKMPPPGSSVIALMSGGMDTTVVISMLLKDYGLKVYPLFVDRKFPSSKKLKTSISFFENYFKERYPGFFKDIFYMNISIPPTEISDELLAVEGESLGGYKVKGIPLQPSLYAHYAFMYSKYIEEVKGEKIRNIFGGWLPSNSELYEYESLASLRSVMLSLSVQDNDFDWQFTSLPMEKDIGLFFDKPDIVRIGSEHNLPLEKTWTCYKGFFYQCGTCVPCTARMDAYKKTKIVDKTIYKDESSYGFIKYSNYKTYINYIKRNLSIK